MANSTSWDLNQFYLQNFTLNFDAASHYNYMFYPQGGGGRGPQPHLWNITVATDDRL